MQEEEVEMTEHFQEETVAMADVKWQKKPQPAPEPEPVEVQEEIIEEIAPTVSN